MKTKLLFSAAFLAILLWGATTGNIQWTQIRSTDRHGTDSKGQSSDGTGTSGNLSKYNSGGGLTDGPALPLSIANGGSGTPTPSLVAGTNVTISGSWPNQTVNASGGGGGGSNFFGLVNFTAPSSVGWTWDNQGTSTVDSTAGYEYVSFAWAGAVQVRLRYATAPATPYTITACMFHDMTGAPPGSSGTGANAARGLFFRDGTGKLIEFSYTLDPAFVTRAWNSSSSFNANLVNYSTSGMTDAYPRNPSWMRIGDDGTNLNFYWSIDGIHWKLFDSRSRTAFFSSGPTQIGYGAYVNGGAVEIALVSWE